MKTYKSSLIDTAIYKGHELSAIYLGSTKFWPSSSQEDPDNPPEPEIVIVSAEIVASSLQIPYTGGMLTDYFDFYYNVTYSDGHTEVKPKNFFTTLIELRKPNGQTVSNINQYPVPKNSDYEEKTIGDVIISAIVNGQAITESITITQQANQEAPAVYPTKVTIDSVAIQNLSADFTGNISEAVTNISYTITFSDNTTSSVGGLIEYSNNVIIDANTSTSERFVGILRIKVYIYDAVHDTNVYSTTYAIDVYQLGANIRYRYINNKNILVIDYFSGITGTTQTSNVSFPIMNKTRTYLTIPANNTIKTDYNIVLGCCKTEDETPQDAVLYSGFNIYFTDAKYISSTSIIPTIYYNGIQYNNIAGNGVKTFFFTPFKSATSFIKTNIFYIDKRNDTNYDTLTCEFYAKLDYRNWYTDNNGNTITGYRINVLLNNQNGLEIWYLRETSDNDYYFDSDLGKMYEDTKLSTPYYLLLPAPVTIELHSYSPLSRFPEYFHVPYKYSNNNYISYSA